MKKTLLLSIGFLFLSFITAYSQEKEKSTFRRNQIGIQFNPYINEQLVGFRRINTVSALRYGYRITRNITTGMELSCNFPIYVNTDQRFRWFSYKVGLVTRYSILPERRLNLFAEASPYYSHEYLEGISADVYRFNKFGAYVAPGVSLYSKSKKFSFDLYYKFSNQRQINGNNSVLSYKLNYNF